MKEICQQYLVEIKKEYELAQKILLCFHDEEYVDDINYSSIINMCIKYEAFTADLFATLGKRRISYNRPWSYTRMIAKKLRVNINNEYHDAHSAWDYYNTLKHVNYRSRIEALKFVKKHNIKNSHDAKKFVHDSLEKLIQKLLKACP